MDWIVSSTVLLRGPMCILILFIGEKIGLKKWLHISALLAIGGKTIIYHIIYVNLPFELHKKYHSILVYNYLEIKIQSYFYHL